MVFFAWVSARTRYFRIPSLASPADRFQFLPDPLMTSRLIALPGFHPEDLPARFPSPWHGAPSECLLRARDMAEACGHFHADCGRRGLLLLRNEANGEYSAAIAEEPFHEPDGERIGGLPEARSILGTTRDDVFQREAARITLTQLSGGSMTLLFFSEKERAKRPAKIARGGGAGLNLNFDHWNRALLEALDAPIVSNLLFAAELKKAGEPLTPVGSLEWWRGAMPSYDVKWDGMVLSPRTTVKPLAEWLLDGIPFASDPRAEDPFTLSLAPEILLEKKDFIAVMKPSGLLSVPGTGGLPDAMTLASRMTGANLTAVHRLDMDTSGILLYAKTPEGTRSLMAAFREGRVQKRYRALLEGIPAGEGGLIDFPITTHPLDRLRQIAAAGGRPSRTRWAKISASNGQTLVDFFPLTGRTHQLRLHAAHPLGLGSPILGDPYYSRAGLIADTPEKPLKLHAAEIHFPNPADGSEIRLLKEESFP